MLAVVVAIGMFSAIPISAQSLCDLVPASVVQSTLGITAPLKATPDTEGGNGCDYKGMAAGPIWIKADDTDYSGIYKTIQDQQFTQLPYGSHASCRDLATKPTTLKTTTRTSRVTS
jgi:hypothetical protein